MSVSNMPSSSSFPSWDWDSTHFSLLGLGLNTLIIFLLKDINIVPRFVDTTLDWDFWIAKIIATAVVMVWNFIANNFFTFRKKRL